MQLRPSLLPIALCAIVLGAATLSAQQPDTPHLEKRGATTQLIVDGQPFFMLSGELHNSSSSNLEYMKTSWPRLAAMSLNTVIVPISWELVEPTEGKYDFALIDGLLAQAREQHLHIVFLWLAAWKNGESSYPPVWVKRDANRFPRAMKNGNPTNILSTLYPATLEADARAFTAVMQHLKEVDSKDHTVLMMQVENEVGILGDTRDHSAAANQAFASAVPDELLRYLKAHKDTLDPELRELWVANGEKTSGNWAQVFGNASRADEIFMAWNYARYAQAVAAKGKAAYALPMYVNAWLASEDSTPGDYPSGGPQPRVIDIWKAAGSALDIYAPDLYHPNFTWWSNRYHRPDNPLFLPETNGGAAGAANVFYALGEHAALGFSPFGIDEWNDTNNDLSNSYSVLAPLLPLVLEQQTKGNVHGFLLDKNHPSVEFPINGYIAHVSLDEIFGSHSEKGFGLIMATGPDEFIGAGKGFRVSFSSRSSTPHVGLASVDEGKFEAGKWIPGRRLNGDENDQGAYWRFDPRQIKTVKATLYHFE
jgi:beta-galactosidase GanA